MAQRSIPRQMTRGEAARANTPSDVPEAAPAWVDQQRAPERSYGPDSSVLNPVPGHGMPGCGHVEDTVPVKRYA